MIIDNGRIKYNRARPQSPYGRDGNGDVVADTATETTAWEVCNVQVSGRTYFAGDAQETFTAAVYTILVEKRPPADALTATLEEGDGTAAGEVKIVNVEPLKAVQAYKITAHAHKR